MMDALGTASETEDPSPATSRKRRPPQPILAPRNVEQFVERLVGDDWHAKRVLSLSNGVVGVIHAAALAVHFIGQGLATAMGTDPKHAIKQVDRLLSNSAISTWMFFARWVPFLVGERKAIRVALDWTEYDRDGQATICLYLLTRHGRATPLVWKTVRKTELKDRRNQYEDEVIERLHELVAENVGVTVLADRGFGDQGRYAHLGGLGWTFVIRFRENILVESADGESKLAADWVPTNGRPKMLKKARVTADRAEVGAVVCMKAAGMKDAWCLATNRDNLSATQIVELYGRRFTIEETFRDQKDQRFGMGLSSTHIKDPARRDRLLMLAALAQGLLTLLGAASEAAGLDRYLKANTSKKRTHSLFRQGSYWYSALPSLPEKRLRPLMEAFGKIVAGHAICRDVLGVI
jgi:Transposase DDE domain